jgi:hypothetical protein
MAGCAGWTKNEGLLFVAALCVAGIAPVVDQLSVRSRRFAAFMSGLFLPLAAIVFFKLTIATPSELTSNRSYDEVVEKMLSPERYTAILFSFGRTLWTFGEWAINPLLLLALFLAVSALNRNAARSWGWVTGTGSLALVLAGYFAIYVIAPFDLTWLLAGSNTRLFLHLWPPSLLLAGLLAVQYPHAR